MSDLKNLLELMAEKDASDLHLTIGSPPRMRVNGKLTPLDTEKLTAEKINLLLKEYVTEEMFKIINKGDELDFTIGIPGLSRYRVNVFCQRSNLAATFRRLPFTIPNIDSLALIQL